MDSFSFPFSFPFDSLVVRVCDRLSFKKYSYKEDRANKFKEANSVLARYLLFLLYTGNLQYIPRNLGQPGK